MSGEYIPFEYPSTADGEFTAALNEGQILLTRRLQLGLTIQQVADMSGIRFSQYQRMEGGERLFSGCSMKTGMAVCSALLLSPADIIQPHTHAPRRESLSRPPLFDPPGTHRVGRKKSQQDIMELIITREQITVPDEVVTALGKPERIKPLVDQTNGRILLSGDSAGFDVTASIPAAGIFKQPHTVKCRPVRDRKGTLFILADLSTAMPV